MVENCNEKHLIPMLIEYARIDTDSRILAISDIHGNLEGLRDLLKWADLSHDDTLIVVGDMVEKGVDSLGVLQYLRELSKVMPVHIVRGNCENWALMLFEEKQLGYEHIMKYENSLLKNMCESLGIHDYDTNWDNAYTRIHEEYSDLMKWVKELPIIISDENMLIVHAGIKDKDLEKNDANECCRQWYFEKYAPDFGKPVIVGHLPVSNYCDDIPNCNPRYKNGVFSIDGGNNVKEDGQLNLVVFRNFKKMDYALLTWEFGEKMIAKHAQKPSNNPITISFDDNYVKILDETNDMYYVETETAHRRLWVCRQDVYRNLEGKLCCYDTTNYHLPVEVGDELYIYRETEDAYYVKKNGVLGWYEK